MRMDQCLLLSNFFFLNASLMKWILWLYFKNISLLVEVFCHSNQSRTGHIQKQIRKKVGRKKQQCQFYLSDIFYSDVYFLDGLKMFLSITYAYDKYCNISYVDCQDCQMRPEHNPIWYLVKHFNLSACHFQIWLVPRLAWPTLNNNLIKICNL